MPFLNENLKSALQSPLGKNTAAHFTAQLVNAALGIGVYSILTRSLEVEQFGAYSFIIAFFVFTSVFFDFGLTSSGMRLMAVRDKNDDAPLLGALLLLSSAVGVLYVLFTAAASMFMDSLFDRQVGALLLMVAPLAIGFPLQELILTTSQGSGRIRFLSIYLVLPRVLLVSVLVVLFLNGALTLQIAVLASLLTQLAAAAFATGFLRPEFRDLGRQLDIIRKEIKGFGRQVYTGRIVDGLTAGLDRILIAFFHGMAPAGFYAIALTMSSPVSMLSRSLSVSSYKRFAHEEKLPASIMIAVLLWCTLGVLLLVLASQVLIPLLFTAKYAESLSVLPYLALGVGLSGLNQPLHAFLMARRQGRSIKVMSVTTSGLMVALNLLLIPTMGMKGAAIAMVSSYGVNILMNVYYYRSYRRSLSQDTDNVSPQRSGEK